MTPPVNQYDRVRFITDRYQSSGAPIDAIGYVLDMYQDDGL